MAGRDHRRGAPVEDGGGGTQAPVSAPWCGGYTPRRSGIGWVRQTNRAMPPTPAGWGARPTDRSSVGCSHREGCPLFPLLNASLRGWRDHYCDSADRWHDCARYKMSLTGQLVPITLLPNGHDAQLLRPDSDAGRSGGAAGPRPVPGQAPPSRLDSGSPECTVSIPRFEPAPAAAPAEPLEPSAPSPAPQPEPGPTSAPTRLLEPSPVPQSPGRPPARLTRRVRRAHGSTRRWWTRLSDWITGPA